MKSSSYALSLLACLAAMPAAAGSPAYDLKIEAIRGADVTHSLYVPLPNGMQLGQAVTFEEGSRRSIVSQSHQTVRPDGTKTTDKLCSKVFSGLRGTVTLSRQDSLLVNAAVSKLSNMERVEAAGSYLDLPQVASLSSSFAVLGPISTHPRGEVKSWSEADKTGLVLRASVVDRTWLRQLFSWLSAGPRQVDDENVPC